MGGVDQECATMKFIKISIFLIIIFCLTILPAVEAKRSGPPAVKPVTHLGITYTVLHWSGKGLPEYGGFIEARDARTGKHLYYITVYTYSINPVLETDVQVYFIKSMEVKSGYLYVVDERRNRYKINLKTRKVFPIK
jgi:hypothetical protein